jgi:hypothetical protein
MILSNIVAAFGITFLIFSSSPIIVRSLFDISDLSFPPLSDIFKRFLFYRLFRTIQTVPEL